eukprot:g19145.t1
MPNAQSTLAGSSGIGPRAGETFVPSNIEVAAVILKWKKCQCSKKDVVDFVMRFVTNAVTPDSVMSYEQLFNLKESIYNVLRCPAHAQDLLDIMFNGGYIVRSSVLVIESSWEILSGRHSVEAAKKFATEDRESWEALGMTITTLRQELLLYPEILKVFARICNEGTTAALRTTFLEKVNHVYPAAPNNDDEATQDPENVNPIHARIIYWRARVAEL